MAEDELATGTPGAGAEGAVTDSGTPATSTDGSSAASVDADEVAKLRNIRDQFLREKDNTERIRQENDSLRQQMEQANRAYQPPTGYDPAAQRAARIAQVLQNVQDRDPDMVELLSETARMTQEQLQRQQAEQRFYREMGGVPSEMQGEVERKSRAENLWPSISHKLILADRYEKERTDLAEQRRKLQEREDTLKRGVVNTTATPTAPANNNNTMTRSEFAQVARDAAYGNADAKRRMNDYDEGRIKLRDG